MIYSDEYNNYKIYIGADHTFFHQFFAVKELENLDEVITKVYGHFCRSPKQTKELKFWEGALDLDELRMLRLHEVRWLSRQAVVQRLLDILPAVIQVINYN